MWPVTSRYIIVTDDRLVSLFYFFFYSPLAGSDCQNSSTLSHTEGAGHFTLSTRFFFFIFTKRNQSLLSASHHHETRVSPSPLKVPVPSSNACLFSGLNALPFSVFFFKGFSAPASPRALGVLFSLIYVRRDVLCDNLSVSGSTQNQD